MQGLRRMLWGGFLICALVIPARIRADSDEWFRIQSIQPTVDGGFNITWSTAPGWTNRVMYTDSLDQPWQELPGAVLVAGANEHSLSYADQTASVTSQRFYRIKGSRDMLVMSLVLDRSGSMSANGGAVVLGPATSNFVGFFDDQNDRMSMVSFSSAASTDVTMRQPFKAAIKSAVSNLVFNGWTCTERGLTNALVQNQSVPTLPGENVVKVIVLFTDGMANTWYYPNFNCGPRNIGPDKSLYNPNTGANASAGCTVSNTIPSIDGSSTVNTSDQCGSMYDEAQKRAEAIARLARSQGNYIFAIGMGNPGGPLECGRPPLNVGFLKNLANTPDSATYDPSQPVGDIAIAENAAALQRVFQEIAAMILLH
jgi:hypothetical protein